ncbi:hypothetical protein PR202_ga13404 [Eleusine coracana subsp. coracana]|uniref:Response regulatory domain-containing protein n=1 Tax=Eleusine coracana subsp. coracana TaxID=191504 RepID=A0AAV5CES6_ELECO|nr:hypothetical protein PR202_ga13404 [Eleusine coracana subsp. coracana]
MMASSSARTERQGRRRIIRVLLVEDETIHQNHPGSVVITRRGCGVMMEWLLQVIARQLLKAVGGVELDVAVNGAEAVRRVRERGDYYYDLILTDRQMPVMDGHEVCSRALTSCSRHRRSVQATRQIRAMGVATPIVGLSSDCLAADVDAFIDAGADDFVPKPLNTEKLDRVLTKFGIV